MPRKKYTDEEKVIAMLDEGGAFGITVKDVKEAYGWKDSEDFLHQLVKRGKVRYNEDENAFYKAVD